MQWYQLRQGSQPQFIYRYCSPSSQERGSGIPGRFSVEPNRSKNVWELIISGVQVEDDANYYCNLWSDPSHSDTKQTELKLKSKPAEPHEAQSLVHCNVTK
ncbi:hypothetical protein XELAEV_18007656mg [Xenopus laevis]|uniref:Immunoglobulin V-set domain-containing protein n=1 Tax=Xenopus laevis TaxID=8355 RepID=A0A974E2S5_XENLA|nr:hypothetical protein XELAEV_18007656mg [Xenopus laevis]